MKSKRVRTERVDCRQCSVRTIYVMKSRGVKCYVGAGCERPIPRSATSRSALRSRSIVFCHSCSMLRSAPPDFRPAPLRFPLRSRSAHMLWWPELCRTQLGSLERPLKPPNWWTRGWLPLPQERHTQDSFVYFSLHPPDTLSSKTLPPCGQKTVAVRPPEDYFWNSPYQHVTSGKIRWR